MFSFNRKFLLNIVLLLSIIFSYNIKSVYPDISENDHSHPEDGMMVIDNGKILTKNLLNDSKVAVVDEPLVEVSSYDENSGGRKVLQQLCQEIDPKQYNYLKKQKLELKKESRRLEKMQMIMLENERKHQLNIKKKLSEEKRKLKETKKEIKHAMLHLENIIKNLEKDLDAISISETESEEDLEESHNRRIPYPRRKVIKNKRTTAPQ